MIPFYRVLYSWTPKIKDSQGKIKGNSVASLEKVILNGVKQCILIRGHDVNNPLLLLLHGGPGSPEMGIAYRYQRELEKYNEDVLTFRQRIPGIANGALEEVVRNSAHRNCMCIIYF